MINILNGFITIISNISRIESYIYSEIIVRIQRTLDTLVLKKKNLCDQHIQAKNDGKCFFILPLCPHSIHSFVLPTPLLPPCTFATSTFGTTNASIATSLSLIIVVNIAACITPHYRHGLQY